MFKISNFCQHNKKQRKIALFFMSFIFVSNNLFAQNKWVPASHEIINDKFINSANDVDVQKASSVLSKDQEKFRKDDFETSSEHNERIKEIKNNPVPFSSDKEYSFMVQYLDNRYNADKQQLSVRSPYMCEESYMYKELLLCSLGAFKREYSNYVGTNAFGKNMNIKKLDVEFFSLFIDKKSPFFKSNIFINDDKKKSLSILVDLPLEIAKEINNEVYVRVIGHVLSTKLLHGKLFNKSPTVSNPNEVKGKDYAIEFKPTKVIISRSDNDEILMVREF